MRKPRKDRSDNYLEEFTKYAELPFKIPEESHDYKENSDYIISKIDAIMKWAMDNKDNKILIDTNLRLGLPMENINKVAGPFVEAWAYEKFTDAFSNGDNQYTLLNVEAGERLNFADIILQFKKKNYRSDSVTGHVDVKATSDDIIGSGKSPNITSFGRVRSEYVSSPDMIFIILSIKHKVYSTRNDETKMMMGVMEVVGFKSYDLKFLSDADISYNPALGTGQIQIRDIHYVTLKERTSWEFCQLLDKKCIMSKNGYTGWLNYATKYGWLKNDEDTEYLL